MEASGQALQGRALSPLSRRLQIPHLMASEVVSVSAEGPLRRPAGR